VTMNDHNTPARKSVRPQSTILKRSGRSIHLALLTLLRQAP
jgi:hypothetical protein